MNMQAALRAQTDQAMAQVAQNRRRPPDEAAVMTIPLARALAACLADELGNDTVQAGRTLVSAAAKIAGLMVTFDAENVSPQQTSRVIVNVLAFAGEQLAREGGKP